MRTRLFAIGCVVLIAIAVIFIGGVFVFASSIPTVSQQLPPNSGSLLVNLTTPLDASDVPLNTPTSIQASALGNTPIVSLELWVDGNPAETKNAPKPDLKQFDAFWSWTPASPGEHTLIARATDATHQVVSSNVVRINVTQDENSVAVVNYQVKSGDTLPSIAQKSDTTPAQIAAVNPQMNPASPIAPGQTISVPHTSKPPKPNNPPTPTSTPQPSPQATPQASSSLPSSPPLGASFWMQKNLAAATVLPSAPKLQIVSKGCNAELTMLIQANNEDGFFVYRTDPGNSQFKRIATLGTPSTPSITSWSYEDMNVAGPLEYYVSAFNTAGESPSNIVSVTIADRTCTLTQISVLHFANGQISTQQPVDKAYCYLAENSGPFERVPSAANTFIYPTNGIFDVSAYLKTLATTQVTSQMTLDLDCWGWKAGTLTYLGDAKQTFSPQPNAPVQVANDKFKFAGALNLPSNLKPFDPIGEIFPPNALNSTGDPTVCSKHMDPLTVVFGGAQLCASAIQQHYVVLVWDWDTNVLSPNPLVKDIDGYRVFESDAYYQHKPVATSTAGPDVKVTMFPLPAIQTWKLFTAFTGGQNRCFVVRAYKGTLESSDSNTVCLGSSLPGTKTVVLNAATKTVWNRYTNSCAPGDPNKVWGGQLVTGYWFEDLSRDLTIVCGVHNNWALRTLARFDLSQIGVVWRATLMYHLSGTAYSDNADGHDPNRLQIPEQFLTNRSCAVQLMLPTQDWSPTTNTNTDNNLVPGDDYIALPTDGTDFAVDVTSAVSHWHNYGGNYGFELRGANEDTGSEENSQCSSEFSNFVLEVTFFPASVTPPGNLANPGLNPVKP